MIKNISIKIFFNFIIVAFLLSGYTADISSGRGKKPKKQKVIEYNGFLIPLFSSPTKQLNYAFTRTTNLRMKEAALRLIIEFFPEDRPESAEACLELAYLSLGDDFRVADKEKCEDVINQYEDIIERFHDLPGVCAKAYWYIGWIYMDLLHDKDKGMEAYNRVVSGYPDEGFLPFPRLEWQLSFVEGMEKGVQPLAEKESWSALALLEIIRNSNRCNEKKDAANKLISSYPSCLSTGYAMLDLLNCSPLTDDIIAMAKKCLNSGMPYPSVIKNIRQRLKAAVVMERGNVP